MQRVGAALAYGIEGLSSLAARLGALAVLAMMVLITVDVAWRFVFGGSTLLAEEGGGFLLLITVFLPAADLMRRHAHIIVDVVVRRMPDRVAAWLRLVTFIIGLVYVAIFVWQAIVYQNQLVTLGRKSPTILFPLWYVQPFMILGLALLWLMLLVMTVRQAHALLAPRPGERPDTYEQPREHGQPSEDMRV
jgi:TRAP-type C4-dicarboxylate transport system permease small subunit